MIFKKSEETLMVALGKSSTVLLLLLFQRHFQHFSFHADSRCCTRLYHYRYCRDSMTKLHVLPWVLLINFFKYY